MSEAHISQPERLKDKHFDYTLVFGQGPVQEGDKVPSTGREGLNFYSRMIALSAAQMLKEGITDKVILSGGKTGARAKMEEGKTEAELMADLIRTHLRSLDSENNCYRILGQTVPTIDSYGKPRDREDVMRDITRVTEGKILIENQAKDTNENFAKILEKFFAGKENENKRVAMLGIGFHAHDISSGAGVGRLELLANIFGLGNDVYSAEEVLRETTKSNSAYVRSEIARLSNISEHDYVSWLKSLQERLLVEGLHAGQWMRLIPVLKDEKGIQGRLIVSVQKDPYGRQLLREQGRMTEEEIDSMSFDILLGKMTEIMEREKATGKNVFGTDEGSYGQVKGYVFKRLEDLSQDADIIGSYGKSTQATTYMPTSGGQKA